MSESAVSPNVESDFPDIQDPRRYRSIAETAGLEPNLASQLAFTCESLGLAVLPGDRPENSSGANVGFNITQLPAAHTIAAHKAPANKAPTHKVTDDRLNTLCGPLEASPQAVIGWLRQSTVDQANRSGGAFESEPNCEPTTIHEIAGALLKPFEVRGGQVRLAGCTLDESAHLRIGWADESGKLAYRYLSSSGQQLEPGEIAKRGFGDLHTVPNRLRASDRAGIASWVKLACDGLTHQQLVDVTVMWSRRAAGKIVVQFASGRSVSIPFDGWAREYADGSLQPPKFHCSTSGLDSYHLVELDDGSITVAEAIGRCEVSGIELFRDALATCHLTGKLVNKDLLAQCSVTGHLALKDSLEECLWCGQSSLPGVIFSGVCKRCLGRETMKVNEPSLQKLLQRNPQLGSALNRGSLSGWAEQELGLVVATRLSQQAMYVFRLADGVVIRSGTRRRPFGKWQITV